MVYIGLDQDGVDDRRKKRQDWLKAVTITVRAVAAVAALVIGSQQLGIR